ncbi:MAG: RcnB family protein [Pseudomonadota bacterium]|nr:RcnB family protein [Pseudomonadota bacterium]
MRKLMLTVLLATSVALPAMAQDNGGRRDRGEQAESGQNDEARAARRAARAERRQQDERPQRAERPNQPERAQRAELPQAADRANWSARGEARQQAVEQQQAIQQQQRRERRNWGQRGSDDNGAADFQRRQAEAEALQQSQRTVQHRDDRRDDRRDRNRDRSLLERVIEQDRAANGQVTIHRDTDRRYRDRRSGTNRRWSNQWRNDRNYDWRNHRERNRSAFRLGNYYDPYGSRYRRFSIGFSLFPSYYQSNYWISEPSMYRLPPAYGPYRWVRYYDDAVLVNVYNGQVVDVIHGFFW